MDTQSGSLSKLRHDMRGCLNAIQLSVEVLKMNRNGEDSSTFLDCIESELAKLDVLIQQLTMRQLQRSNAA